MSSSYLTTDLDLRSEYSISQLLRELDEDCVVLAHLEDNDGLHSATVEVTFVAEHPTPESEIRVLLAAIAGLSEEARREWNQCHCRVFNMGFRFEERKPTHHLLSAELVQRIVEVGGSISITLYPPEHSSD